MKIGLRKNRPALDRWRPYAKKLVALFPWLSRLAYRHKRQAERLLLAHDIGIIGKHFDTEFYTATNPDVAGHNIDPAVHFLQFGWREQRNPNPKFNVRYYLDNNPDVIAAGLNPLVHYLLHGRAEGRLADNPINNIWRLQLESLVPVAERAKLWAGARNTAIPLAGEALQQLLETSARNRPGMIFSASTDDYLVNTGGMQNLIGAEQAAFTAAGWAYLHFSPAAPLPVLAENTAPETFHIQLRLDGKTIGVARFADLLAAASTLQAGRTELQLIVHHLMGQAPELLAALAQALGVTHPVIWTHDFFTLCPSYALLRNDVKFCHGPPPSSQACGICAYGELRQSHYRRMETFFATLQPRVIAPSEFARDFWRARGYAHFETMVLPVAALAFSGPRAVSSHERLRIAHLGMPSFHKGWPVFAELAEKMHGNPYEFFQFSTGLAPGYKSAITLVPVNVTPANPDAMVEALRAHEIDVVINWSQCAETFSVTTLEALAAGAFVVARAGAGNVWPLIQQNAPQQGIAVEDEEALLALLADSSFRDLVRNAPCRIATIIRNPGTASWLLDQRQPKAAAALAATR